MEMFSSDGGNPLIHIKFTKQQLNFLAEKIGRRLLKSDKYLDGLQDILEGEEPENILSESNDSEPEDETVI